MAISTDSAIDFFGTQTTITAGGGTSSVADAAFSVSGDVVSGGWTNADDAKEAAMVFAGTYSVAPDANSSVDLYLRPLNIDGTNDQDTPDANFPHVYVGSFPLNDVTSAQYCTIVIALPNVYTSQVYEPYIQNNGGQTLSAGWTIKATTKAIGPHA